MSDNLRTLLSYSASIMLGTDQFTRVVTKAGIPAQTCIYCRREVGVRDFMEMMEFEDDHDGLEDHWPVFLGECECGWWWAITYESSSTIFVGALQRFAAESADVPVEVLRTEISKHPHLVHDVDPKRMEDLVASILRGVYDCEVEHLGYSRDGGIDLLLFITDDPIAIQVKRRSRPDAVEGVSTIREFLGAVQLAQHDQALFVTTAKKYSRAATEAAKSAVDQNLVRAYHLMDRDKLIALLRDCGSVPAWQIGLERMRVPDTDGDVLSLPRSIEDIVREEVEAMRRRNS